MLKHVLNYYQYLADTFEKETWFDPLWLSSGAETEAPRQNSRRDQMVELHNRYKNCHLCTFARERKKMIVGAGNCDAQLLIIGLAPFPEDIKSNYPLVGRYPDLIDKMMKHIGLDRDCIFTTTFFKCPLPLDTQVAFEQSHHCRQMLVEQLSILNPKAILLLGEKVYHLFYQSRLALASIRAKQVYYQKIPVLVTWDIDEIATGDKTLKLEVKTDLERIKGWLNGH